MTNYKVTYKGKVVSEANFRGLKKYFILGFNTTHDSITGAGFIMNCYTNGQEIRWYKKFKKSGLTPNYVVFEFKNNEVEITDEDLEKNFTEEYVNRFHTKLKRYGTISKI